MGLFSKSEARPYIVTFREGVGVPVKYHVVAYDAMEALMSANTEATVAGMVEPTLIGICPDEEELAKRGMSHAVGTVLNRLEYGRRARSRVEHVEVPDDEIGENQRREEGEEHVESEDGS